MRTPPLELNERKKALLNIVASEYIRTASPMSSDTIARHYGLGVSSATVRNDMADLEEMGYITRPHPSAGGVPADNAYRFYVEQLTGVVSPPPSMRAFIRRQLQKAERDVEAWTRLAAAILSQVVHNAAIATFPQAERSRLKHLELVRLQEFLALLVLVLHQVRLRPQLLPVETPVTQEELTTTANKLNTYLCGKTRAEMTASAVPDPSPLEQRVTEESAHLMEAVDRQAYEDHHIEGLRHMLSQPEFTVASRAREAVEVLEDRGLVADLLAQASDCGTVRVIIGQENRRDSLRPFSVVICQYGVPGEATGVVSVIGPTRMDYATAMTGVQYLSQLMGELLSSVQERS